MHYFGWGWAECKGGQSKCVCVTKKTSPNSACTTLGINMIIHYSLAFLVFLPHAYCCGAHYNSCLLVSWAIAYLTTQSLLSSRFKPPFYSQSYITTCSLAWLSLFLLAISFDPFRESTLVVSSENTTWARTTLYAEYVHFILTCRQTRLRSRLNKVLSLMCWRN